jgi:hypothetical protein
MIDDFVTFYVDIQTVGMLLNYYVGVWIIVFSA